LSLSFALNACKQQNAQMPPGVFGPGSQADCLPNVTLVDQRGNSINLASLKGRLVLVDFIYTTCPGPCELMTARLGKVADRLGAGLGNQVEIVSITLDPEHDGSQQLLDFANAQNAQRHGWLFLTGEPKNVEDVMASFKVQRRREPSGMIDHVIEFFLVGRDGRELRQYNPNEASPEAVANDVMGFVGR
jgi:protein SCO1/2